ncbi:MAG TPA: hypothetical protein VFC82_01325 [Actinomycetaceae bacterium]|nr:hypothetical protein [Actinomycetaceae bacterium]
MAPAGVPEWLVPAFVRSVAAIGATAPRDMLEEEGSSLIERWSTVDRCHHGVSHLVAVLERVDTLAQETHHPNLVRIAAWYHGAVFDSTMHSRHRRAAGENKPDSAALARHRLTRLGVPETTVERVHDLIMNLVRHDPHPADADAAALCDAHLGTLAVEPQKYKAYRIRVREEYAHVPARDFVESRIAIITKLLARRQLFISPMASSWEQPARQNFEAELVLLRNELATLPPRAEGDQPIEEVPVPAPLRPSTVDDDISRTDQESVRAPTEKYAGEDVPTPVAVTPAQRATVPDDDGDPAEVIGLPFDEQATAPTPAEPAQKVSGIEQAPIEPSDLPRRIRIADAAAAADNDRKNAKSVRARPSTPRRDDPDVTGSLFRPIDP